MSTFHEPLAAARELSLRFPGEPGSIRRARCGVQALHGDADRVADVRLLVSELFTAAVCDGADPIDLRLVAGTGLVRVEVVTPYWRKAPRPPHDPLAALSSCVVDAICDAHGRDGQIAWGEVSGDWWLDSNAHVSLPGWGCQPDVW